MMITVYNAPKPRYSVREWIKFIAIRTVFPPILLWDLIKLGGNKLFGELVGGLVLPAQNADFFGGDIPLINDGNHYNEENLTCYKHQVITHDKAQLDTFEIKHTSQKNTDFQDQTYIINLIGNGMCYEQIVDKMIIDAQQLNTNVVGFNFRGVRQSTGKAKSTDNLVVDGIAQVQRLLDNGVPSQNITLKGHSLGAGVASLVAQHFHQLGQPVNLFNSRSFSTITNVVVGQIRLQRNENGKPIGHKDSIGMTILGWLAKPFIKLGIGLVKWEINAGSAYKSIPEAYKDYIVVRSNKDVRRNRIDDSVIPHYASIHEYLTPERKKKKAEIDKEIDIVNSMISNPVNQVHVDYLKTKQDELLKKRGALKDRKMMTNSDNAEENGHNASSESLINPSKTNAQTFFWNFVRKTAHAKKNTQEVPFQSV